ncbi:class I SAM-dependent methyltransferase [Clostridium butyricum]|uniref:class I SAM-dependent methyltransferase n=1 Tax=Clostridium butyricum TaxID=1492 RepID=UPI001969DCAD|nr:class I SAM-dependent methyltransferase [Clostridium butyricum]MCQ2022238.1 class I SAM-dependent methyltransferase [Clostridium butyricum]
MININNLKTKKIIGWGTGELLKQCLKKFNIKLDYIIDNNTEKWDKSINEILIKNPDSLMQEDVNDIVIVIFSSFYEDIIATILRYGKFKFYYYSELDCYYEIGVNNEYKRFKWVIDNLQKLADGSRILDAGAGEQKYKRFCNTLEYVSQDFNQYDGNGNRSGLQTQKWDYSGINIVCDIISIPQPNESFDTILCTEVFEHLPNPIKAIEEFSRLIRKGGKLILSAPFCSLTHFAPYHYYSGFNNYFYEYHLKNNNFKILEIVPNGSYFEYIAQELRRLSYVTSKYSTYKLNEDEKHRIEDMINILKEIQGQSKESDGLLCSGYQIVAEKE